MPLEYCITVVILLQNKLYGLLNIGIISVVLWVLELLNVKKNKVEII